MRWEMVRILGNSDQGAMRRDSRSHLSVVLLAVLFGCADATIIRSSPPGANVYYNNQLVGVTPTKFVSHERQSEYVLRLEKEGYRSQELTVAKHMAPGRVVGGVFSLGIAWLFKPPMALPDPLNVELNPLPVVKPAANGPSSATSPSAISNDLIEQRLRRVQELFDRGIISEPEYRRYRAEILKDL